MSSEALSLRVVIILPVALSVEPDDEEVAEVERTRHRADLVIELG